MPNRGHVLAPSSDWATAVVRARSCPVSGSFGSCSGRPACRALTTRQRTGAIPASRHRGSPAHGRLWIELWKKVEGSEYLTLITERDFNPDPDPPARHNVSDPGITLLTSQVLKFRGEGHSVVYRVVMKRDSRYAGGAADSKGCQAGPPVASTRTRGWVGECHGAGPTGDLACC
jgi:hypothetical protein